jgi:hypothetical protein
MKAKHLVTEFDNECNSMPELIKIDYSCEFTPTKLTATIESLENDKRAIIEFQNIVGFRVLDEGDLMEFWTSDSRPKGWLWEINKGGWFDLEIQRQISITLKTLLSGNREFLIAGAGKCLNIICYDEPKVTVSK